VANPLINRASQSLALVLSLIGISSCATGNGMFVAGSSSPNEGFSEEEYYEDQASYEDPGDRILTASGNVLLPGSGTLPNRLINTSASGPAGRPDLVNAGLNGALGALRGASVVGVQIATPVASASAQVNASLTGPVSAGVGLATPIGPVAVQAQVGSPLLASPTAVTVATPVATVASSGLLRPITVSTPAGGPVSSLASNVLATVAPTAGPSQPSSLLTGVNSLLKR
jgi:hypothetical protein